MGAFGGTAEAARTFVDSDDDDGLPDYGEAAWCTNPFDADTDDPGIPDGAEDANHNGHRDPWRPIPAIRIPTQTGSKTAQSSVTPRRTSGEEPRLLSLGRISTHSG